MLQLLAFRALIILLRVLSSAVSSTSVARLISGRPLANFLEWGASLSSLNTLLEHVVKLGRILTTFFFLLALRNYCFLHSNFFSTNCLLCPLACLNGSSMTMSSLRLIDLSGLSRIFTPRLVLVLLGILLLGRDLP